jgi:hypothetical protein
MAESIFTNGYWLFASASDRHLFLVYRAIESPDSELPFFNLEEFNSIVGPNAEGGSHLDWDRDPSS